MMSVVQTSFDEGHVFGAWCRTRTVVTAAVLCSYAAAWSCVSVPVAEPFTDIGNYTADLLQVSFLVFVYALPIALALSGIVFMAIGRRTPLRFVAYASTLLWAAPAFWAWEMANAFVAARPEHIEFMRGKPAWIYSPTLDFFASSIWLAVIAAAVLLRWHHISRIERS